MPENADKAPRPIAAHYCGQKQPHAAHVWETPPTYGSATFVQTYQCAGLAEHGPLCLTCEDWWITTNFFARSGEKVMGPFVTRELAIAVRSLLETVRHNTSYFIDSEKRISPGQEQP